jgi:hypothetical protein
MPFNPASSAAFVCNPFAVEQEVRCPDDGPSPCRWKGLAGPAPERLFLAGPSGVGRSRFY